MKWKYIALVAGMGASLALGAFYGTEIKSGVDIIRGQPTQSEQYQTKSAEKTSPVLSDGKKDTRTLVTPTIFANYNTEFLKDEIKSLRARVHYNKTSSGTDQPVNPVFNTVAKLVDPNDIPKMADQMQDYSLKHLPQEKVQDYLLNNALRHLPEYNLSTLSKLDEAIENRIAEEMSIEERAKRKYDSCKTSLPFLSKQALDSLEGVIDTMEVQ